MSRTASVETINRGERSHVHPTSKMIDPKFFKVVFPVTKPGLVAAGILAFVGAWNEFLFAVILTINKSKTLPVVISGFITDKGLSWGPMAATSVITLVPILIIVWVAQKQFVQGLAMGAVKG